MTIKPHAHRQDIETMHSAGQFSARWSPRRRGFTLFEVLVVLTLIGLIAGIVTPRLPVMFDRFDYALKRESVEHALSGLSYQAFSTNQDIVLSGVFTANGRVEDPDAVKALNLPQTPASTAAATVLAGTVIDPAPISPAKPLLTVPPGWAVVASDPITIYSTGYCKGGKVDVVVGESKYTYTLSPPLCAVEPSP